MTKPTRLPLVGATREQALKALSGDDPLDAFPAFIEAVSQRLERGLEAYGDASFDRPITELLTEIEEETLDLTGWGYVLWSRIQRLKSRIAR